ncbi:hypothetical protein QBC36DRAFT_320133 [Triangularia setosa]|uniref:Uncharacterized protein n=1 Tax=Triangularia setosa TaxID=2587417 RepID=A0AAN6WEG8_9PEZI|nr:hypothetical protein QBC36DRAFT_320133 [Podospora setosa]
MENVAHGSTGKSDSGSSAAGDAAKGTFALPQRPVHRLLSAPAQNTLRCCQNPAVPLRYYPQSLVLSEVLNVKTPSCLPVLSSTAAFASHAGSSLGALHSPLTGPAPSIFENSPVAAPFFFCFVRGANSIISLHSGRTVRIGNWLYAMLLRRTLLRGILDPAIPPASPAFLQTTNSVKARCLHGWDMLALLPLFRPRLPDAQQAG